MFDFRSFVEQGVTSAANRLPTLTWNVVARKAESVEDKRGREIVRGPRQAQCTKRWTRRTWDYERRGFVSEWISCWYLAAKTMMVWFHLAKRTEHWLLLNAGKRRGAIKNEREFGWLEMS